MCVKFVKCGMRKCFHVNNDVYLALLQIHSTAIDPVPPSPAALMLNRPKRDLMPKVSNPFILFDHDDDHSAVLTEGQQNADKNNGAHKCSPFIPTESTVAVHREDGSPWTHQMAVGHGSKEHNSRSYKIRVTKIGDIITRAHRPYPHLSKDYLCDELEKKKNIINKQQAECVDSHICHSIWQYKTCGTGHTQNQSKQWTKRTEHDQYARKGEHQTGNT